MKKILSIIITLCLVLTSAAVFAETEATTGNTSPAAVTSATQTNTDTDEDGVKPDKSQKQALKAEKAAKVQQMKAQRDAAKAELKVIKDKIKANKATIKSLQAKVRELHKLAKENIKAIIKDKENLTQETVDELKDMLAQLRDDRSSMCETFGMIKEDALDIAMAKKNNDPEKIKERLTHVLEVQQERIDKLNKIIETLKKIAEYKAE